MVKDFEKLLGERIQKIEGKSSLEIVPVIVKKASSYFAWSLVHGLVLSYLITDSLSYTKFQIPNFSIAGPIVFVLLGLLIGFTIRHLKIFRFLIPNKTKQERALTMLHALFANEGVFETKKRLGILVVVFEFEKIVLVMADKGFNSTVEPKFWNELGIKLASDFNSKNPGNEFFEALDSIEKEIVPKIKVPENSVHENELSDHLRKR